MKLSLVLIAGLLLFGGLLVVPTDAGITDHGDGTATYLEDFTDDVVFDPPTETWYTYDTSGTGSGTVRSVNGTKVFRSDFGTSWYAGFTPSSDIEPMLGQGVDSNTSFAVAVRPYGGSWNGQIVRLTNTLVGSNGLKMQFDAAGNLNFTVQGQHCENLSNGCTPVQVFTATVAGPTNVSSSEALEIFVRNGKCTFSGSAWTGTDCDQTHSQQTSQTCTVSFDIIIPSLDYTATVSATYSTSFGGTYWAKCVSGANVLVTSGADMELTYFSYDSSSPALAPVAYDDAVAVNNLVGFAIDQTGATVIARLDSGDNVTTYSAGSLTLAGTTETDCNQVDGVAVSRTGTHVAYINCDAGAIPDAIRFRSSSLTAPVVPSGCSSFTGDAADVNFDAVAEDMRQINNINGYDLDYSNCETAGANTVVIEFAFSTYGGRVGLFGHAWINNLPDQEEVYSVQFDATAGPQVDQICRYSDTTDGEQYLIAVTQNGAGRSWRVNPDPLTLTEHGVGSGAFGNGVGVACGGNRILIARSGSVTLGTKTFAATLDSFLATTDTRGVALSGSGQWGAYVDDAIIYIFDTTTGNTTGVLDFPTTGSLVGMAFDYNAQSLWVAKSDGIYRWDTVDYTTVTAVGNPLEEIPGGTTTTTTTTSGSVGLGGGDPVADLSASTGLPASFVGFILSAFLLGFTTVGCAAPTFLATKSTPFAGTLTLVAGGLGFVGGAILGYVLGYLSGGVLAFMVFIGLCAVVVAFFIGRR